MNFEKASIIISCTIFASLPIMAKKKKICNSNQEAIEHIANLPLAPAGYRWVVNEDFSDEFDGKKLDSGKWHAKSPYWTNGRPPAQFKAENVSVKGGKLRITNTILSPTEGNDGKPGDKYSLAGGAVASVSQEAHYGYYETRMKASMTTMSSTFWLSNMGVVEETVNPDGKKIKRSHSQELDIIETMGVVRTLTKGEKSWNYEFNKRMNSNTHYWIRGGCLPADDLTAPKIDINTLETDSSGEDFHTYGCWWIDANTVKIYYDGKYMYTIKPDTSIKEEPFSRPMFMHLVTETYDWEPGVPTAKDQKDKDKATTYYDWVRSYKLEKI